MKAKLSTLDGGCEQLRKKRFFTIFYRHFQANDGHWLEGRG